MVNVRLCKVYFFPSPRHFDFLNCKTETSKWLNVNTRHSDIIQKNKQKDRDFEIFQALQKNQEFETALKK